jgi:hypothetical protein
MNTSLKNDPKGETTIGPNKPVRKWPVLERDKLFIERDKELIWKKYCGFLGLPIDDFMTTQKLLLMEQVELTMGSQLGQKLLGDRKPRNINEFREFTPLTRYGDYQPYLGEKDAKALAIQPVVWAPSSGRTGAVKWVPFSLNTLNALVDDFITALILSAANRKGEVILQPDSRVLLSLPLTGLSQIIGRVLNQRLPYRAIGALGCEEQTEVDEIMEPSLRTALHTGLDYSASAAIALAGVGEQINQMVEKTKYFPSWHPLAIFRLLKAAGKSRLLKRSILPKDIWRVKGLVSGGTEAALYRERIYHCWGVQLLDIYISTEAGFMAVQGWNKQGMTLLPYRNFYEFIPQSELIKCQIDENYQPSTVLFNELKDGNVYEIVITNFRGGPFLRYRLGDLVKVVSLQDKEMKVNLPQINFYDRVTGALDCATIQG